MSLIGRIIRIRRRILRRPLHRPRFPLLALPPELLLIVGTSVPSLSALRLTNRKLHAIFTPIFFTRLLSTPVLHRLVRSYISLPRIRTVLSHCRTPAHVAALSSQHHNGFTVLGAACYAGGGAAVMQILLGTGMAMEVGDFTPLHLLAMRGDSEAGEAIRVLAEKGADVEKVQKQTECTALMLAVVRGKLATVRALVRVGAARVAAVKLAVGLGEKECARAMGWEEWDWREPSAKTRGRWRVSGEEKRVLVESQWKRVGKMWERRG